MGKITQDMIKEIVAAIGGGANIAQCGNCMTRLRITLHNDQLADNEAIKKIPGVMTVINSNNQLQIVLGPGKAKTAADLMNKMLEDGSVDMNAPAVESNQTSLPEQSAQADLSAIASAQKKSMKAKQTSAIHNFLSKFAAIFTPLIPGFISAGLLLGLATLLKQSLELNDMAITGMTSYLIGYMTIFSKGLFGFLAIMIGYNAQKAFGGTGVNGAIIAALFIVNYNPEVKTAFDAGMTSFFGLEINPKGNIVGVLIAAIIGASVEKWVRSFVPDTLDMILTSTITLLIMGVVTYVAIMPLSFELFKGMSWLFSHLNGNPLGCAILAGLFLIAVMFGIHQGFVPVYFALVETQGFNSLFPILAMAGAGQVGAALALYVRSAKGAVLRNQIRGAIIPGFLGIGEPLIYGVTLPRVKPFITACIGGACGGFFIGIFAWLGMPMGLNTVFGPSGLIAIPLMTSGQGVFFAMTIYVGGLLVAYAGGFILTLLFGTKNIDLS